MEERKNIKAKNYDLTFSKDEEQWIERVENFGIYESIEFTVDLERQSFTEDNWLTLSGLIDFLEINLATFVEKSIEPLTSFAVKSGYFNEEQLQYINFGFLNWVQIVDNTFSANDYNWNFELEFSINNIENTIENIDAYGRWTITFSGKAVSGIRRITW
ncbi:hypothetical protein [Pedobacter sp. MC2016-24]|uniref:hypothetical protein n=1 Tax=Pedobacter sp. MC2016-24 TaxID=2780090 RepID=UPI0018813464|nr:hypothetical protein [Pedobacter sp. MC2016-24]MBE9599479.1 hypothetical protein [Pedobacter sp. MC2016-24]